jgi:N-acetyl-D-muramate 6-phosphate phosphatase
MSVKSGIVSGEIDVSRVRAVLFDVDGTLSDTDDHMVDQVSRFLEPVSWLFKNRDPQSFARWLVLAMETPANFLYGLADKVGLDGPLSRIYDLISRRSRTFKTKHNRFWIIPGIKEMLTALNKTYPMGVVSARDALTTRHFLENFDLLGFFKVIVTSQTCKHTKPYPDPVLYAAEELGVAAKNCLIVGDTIVDVHAGKAAGAQTVAVLCGFGTQRELKRAGADLLLERTPALIEILK